MKYQRSRSLENFHEKNCYYLLNLIGELNEKLAHAENEIIQKKEFEQKLKQLNISLEIQLDSYKKKNSDSKTETVISHYQELMVINI